MPNSRNPEDPSDFPSIENESDPRLRGLIDVLREGDSALRSAAAWTLGKGAAGLAPAVDALAGGPQEPQPDGGKMAAGAVEGMGRRGAPAAAGLGGALTDAGASVRKGAAGAV